VAAIRKNNSRIKRISFRGPVCISVWALNLLRMFMIT
jgi:hypothetical protein